MEQSPRRQASLRIVAAEQALKDGELAGLLAERGQLLLPVLDLILSGRKAVDELIDHMGREVIGGLLELSAREVAGAPRRGKSDDDPATGGVHRFGYQEGVVPLSDRSLRVRKPRLRTRGAKRLARGAGPAEPSREVPIPAYEALRSHPGAGEHVLRLLSRGVSTRDYGSAIRSMAGTLGVSKSSVSREFIERTETAHDDLMARRFDDIDILAIYIDGKLFGEHHAITALGITAQGDKLVLGVVHGGSENAQAVKTLLTSLVERGIRPDVPRLFIIDGSKAIRAAIREVFGSESPVQRCVVHKVRNVQERLPKEKRAYAKMLLTAAVKMPAEKGLAKLKAYAKELEVSHADAAASLREGMEDLFTVSRLGLPETLARSLRSTNPIESPQGLIARFSRRVKNWRSPGMVLRWHAAACLDAEERMHKVFGAKHLDLLRLALRPRTAPQRRSA
jgi:transposase-like protein